MFGHLLKWKVIPSQRVTQIPYDVWALIEMQGYTFAESNSKTVWCLGTY